MKTIPTAGIILFNVHDEVLLVEHLEDAKVKVDIWGLPAGKIKENETALQTAVRELFEETGLTVNHEDLRQVPEEYKGKMLYKGTMTLFPYAIFYTNKYEGEIRGTQKENPKWIKISEIDNLELLPNVSEAIHRAVEVIEK